MIVNSDCPSEIDPLYEDLRTDDTAPNIEDVLMAIRDEHNATNRDPIIYTFTPGGMEAFRNFHDDIVARRAAVPFDENRRGILSKAKGQLARIAPVAHALEQAAAIVDHASAHTSSWSFAITNDTVEHAIHLMNHFISQKFTLMPEDTTQGQVEYSVAGISGDLAEFLCKNDLYIRKLLCCGRVSLLLRCPSCDDAPKSQS